MVQIAADNFVVTVVVQCEDGTVVMVLAMSVLGYCNLESKVGVVSLMCLANLRGLREARMLFALYRLTLL